MKLPGIEYNTQVRSLGRESVSAPIAVANAQAAALGNLGKTIEKIEMNDVAAAAAKFQTEMADLNASAKNRKSYTTEELDSLGIKYDNRYGADKISEVPAYLVSSKVYQKLSSELYNVHSGLTTKKGRDVIAKMYGQMYKEGISVVVANSMREALSSRSIAVESNFDSAVAAGNTEAANIISETALASGVWSNEKYYSKTKDMPDKIATSQYLNNLNNIGDPNTLQVFLNSALADTRLKPSSKNSIYKNYDSKIKSLNKEMEKMEKEARKQESYDEFVVTSTDIIESGEPMEWGAVSNKALNMEPADGKALITLNRMMATKGIVTDPKIHMNLTAMVRSLSLPREGTTVNQRRETAVNQLLSAAGINPFTGEQVSVSKISPADFSKLWGDINKSQSFAYDNPEVKRMSDFIWSTLTGGSKDMMTRFFGAGADTINATKAESDMLRAARAGGPAFNPDQWWEQNGLKYLTASIEENEQTMIENRLDKFIIRDFNSPGGIDIQKTAQSINDRIKAGSMTQEDGNKAMKDIYELQRKKVERMQMLNKPKSEN